MICAIGNWVSHPIPKRGDLKFKPYLFDTQDEAPKLLFKEIFSINYVLLFR